MIASRLFAAAAALTVTFGGAAALADPSAAVEARQAQFKLFSFNVGAIAPMAQGNVEYDSEVAAMAAANLEALVNLDQSRKWPEGSDNAAFDGTRALPAIWEDLEDFGVKMTALQDAVDDLVEVAGDGLDPMRGALGPVANACSACHQAYRAPQ